MKQWLNRPVLIAAAGISLLMLVLTAIEPNALRTMLAVSFVLFIPGFAMTFILFDRDRLGIPERILLSVGLSVAMTALIGLLLNWTPAGLRKTALWTSIFLVIALEALVIIFVRRLRWTDVVGLPLGLNFTARQWVLMGLAALVTMMAIWVARAPAPQRGLEGYTLLWVQPTSAPDMIRLGVDSEEFETRKYRLEFVFQETSLEGPKVELEPGETWQGVLRFPVDLLAGEPVTVLLYRLDNPEQVYRHVVWWPPTK